MRRAAEMSITLLGPCKKRKKKKRKIRKGSYVRVDLSSCRYPILRIALKKLGWEATTDDTKPWHLIWTDTSIGPDKLMMLKRGQKINHFVGMLEICRKKALARNLSMMRKIFPAAYKFFPRAFILPNQLTQFFGRFNSPKPRTYILKPDNGSMGRGVVLVQSCEEVKNAMKGLHGANFVAQKYLTKPLLLNGYKFDLRIYVLILSCDPLRLYLYKEGLARFCTEKYMKPDHKNIKVSRMHLTNYSLNKYSSNFEFNNSTSEVNKGSKWTLTALFKALAAQGFDVDQLDMQIKRMVVLTVVAIVPVLVHSYKTCLNEDDNGRSCFELLGLDVLLDEKCKPWLLEVNHSPSFSIDTPLDHMVKEALIVDTLKIINIDPTGMSKSRMEERRDAQLRLYGKSDETPENGEPADVDASTERTQTCDEYELENMGNFDRIYPTEDANLQNFYDRCMAGATELFSHSFDMKVKKEIAKVQQEKRQEELEKQAQERKRKLQQDVQRRAREVARNVALMRKNAASPVHVMPAKLTTSETAESIAAVVDALSSTPSPGLSTPKSDKLDVEEEIFSVRSLLCDPHHFHLQPPQLHIHKIATSPSPQNLHQQQQDQQMQQRELWFSKNDGVPPSTQSLTARGYVKSVRAESRCNHCNRHQVRAMVSRNASSTSDFTSYLTSRFTLDKARPTLPLKKIGGSVGGGAGGNNAAATATAAAAAAIHIPESMKQQFRAKLLSAQKSGSLLSSHLALFKPLPLQRLPWDSSMSLNRSTTKQRLNFMLTSQI